MGIAKGFATGFQAAESLQDRLERQNAIAQDRIYRQEAEDAAAGMDEAIRAAKRPVIELRTEYEARLAEGGMDPQEEQDWHRRIHNAATLAMQTEFDVSQQLVAQMPGNPYIANIAKQRGQHVIERFKAASQYAQNTLNTLGQEQAEEGLEEERGRRQERWEGEAGLRSAEEERRRAAGQRDRALAGQAGKLRPEDQVMLEQTMMAEWSQLGEEGQKDFWKQEQGAGRIPGNAPFSGQAAMAAYKARRFEQFQSGTYEYPDIQVGAGGGQVGAGTRGGPRGWGGGATRERVGGLLKGFQEGAHAVDQWVADFLGMPSTREAHDFVADVVGDLQRNPKAQEIVGTVLDGIKSGAAPREGDDAESAARGLVEGSRKGWENTKRQIRERVTGELKGEKAGDDTASREALASIAKTAARSGADTKALMQLIKETLGDEAAAVFATMMRAENIG
jgi:hypothetical protein